MKQGDRVKVSDKNLNHLGNDVCAYANMEGIVHDVWPDGGFSLDCDTAWLIVPMRTSSGYRSKGIWIYLNGDLILHKPTEIKSDGNSLMLKIMRFFFRDVD
jgi:translation initiation factor IF-1